MAESGYDKIAREYYDARHVTSRNFDHATQRGLKEHPFAMGTHGLVLELGAGRGRAIEYLGIEASRIVQLDSSEAMLALSDREPCLLKVRADACEIPLSSQQFETVVGFLVDPFLGLSCLAEAYRMLTTGGRLLITTPTFSWGAALRKKLDLDVMTTRFRLVGTETIVKLPSLLHPKDKLQAMLERVGFRDIQIFDHALPAGEHPISPDIEAACASIREALQLAVVHTIRATR